MEKDEADRFRLYLVEIQHFGSPAELRTLLRDLGSIDDVRERHAVIEAIIRERQQRAAWWTAAKIALTTATAVLVFLAAIRALLPAGVWPW
jgi:cell division protein FtsX